MKKILIIAILFTGLINCAQMKENRENESLINAIKNNDMKEFEQALTSEANVNYQENEYGHTALMYAAINGNKEMVELLIRAGAQVNLQSKYGSTALMFAASHGNKEVVELLIQAGADINLQTKFGGTALMLAALKGYKEIAELLIKAKAALNMQDTISRQTALIVAVQYDKPEIVTLLLEAGSLASADTTIKDKYGKTFFDYMKDKPEIQKVYQAYLESPLAKERQKAVCQKISEINKLIPDVENLIAQYCI